MKALNQVGHLLVRASVQTSKRRFDQSRKQLEAIQRNRLAQLLALTAGTTSAERFGIDAKTSWEAYAHQVPLTDYSDWKNLIESQRQDQAFRLSQSPVMRYQPTSGSTSAVKWIPYTGRFLDELDGAICPWIGDLYDRYPGIRQGAHYWSLSWVPTEMRATTRGHINDDMKLLSAGKRWLVGATQAVPDQVSLAPTSDDSLFATLAYLVARVDLTAISIWSPTFGLGLLEKLALWREELAEVLKRGNWSARTATFGSLPCPRAPLRAAKLMSWNGSIESNFFRELWPQLALVSAWDTAAAAPWARHLHSLLPQAQFQGKGLWATEGVVTIPYQDKFVLACRSHVYEFEDVETQQILAPWQLEEGQEVIPILSTGSGLLRYRMNDVLVVDGYQGELPCLRFLGRNDGVDLVGEKISAVLAQQLLEELEWPPGVSPVTLLGADEGGANGRPAYVLLAEASADIPRPLRTVYAERLAEQLELRLNRHFHYLVARNLNQLGSLRCLCLPNARQVYLEQCRERGMIEGNIKIEALRHWRGPLPMDMRTTRNRRGVRAAT